MLLKTHYLITLFFILLLIPAVEHKIVFVIVALIATQLPDVDARYSKLGSKKIARILQWFTKHRGMIHSFTFLLSLTIILVLIFPIAGFGFFLGYGLHLFADSFTPDGIRPFYPSKKSSSWKIRTGGKIEKVIMVILIVANVALLLKRIGIL
ncbi:MAG: metal-dependent hydrolase [Nanoarchaeota archaeon]